MTVQSESITAVIVLYERAPVSSEAFTSLQAVLANHPVFASKLHLLIYDNSPAPDKFLVPDTPYALRYIHDPENGGLYAAFDCALQQARAHGSDWLLLLDQDTSVTAEYVDELIAAMQICAEKPRACAIVPLLEFEGTIFSPEETFSYHMRHQFRYIRYFRASVETRGLQSRAMNAYNSGAAIRVSALLEIGGFPKGFAIDYLDFALFHLLHARGYFLYVLPTRLLQELSHGDLDEVPLARHTSVLKAQTRFMKRYGTLLDRVLFRVWLLRMSRRYRESCSDPRVWKNMVRQALLPFGQS